MKKSIYFTDCKSIQELKKSFQAYAKQFHPDIVGSSDESNKKMADIINEYEVLKKILPSVKSDNSQADMTDDAFNLHVSAEMAHIIDSISHLPINIEVIGSWLWRSGETYAYRSYLSAFNFAWCPKKKMFSWHMEKDSKQWKGKAKDIDDIRGKYGSNKVSNKFRPTLV